MKNISIVNITVTNRDLAINHPVVWSVVRKSVSYLRYLIRLCDRLNQETLLFQMPCLFMLESWKSTTGDTVMTSLSK